MKHEHEAEPLAEVCRATHRIGRRALGGGGTRGSQVCHRDEHDEEDAALVVVLLREVEQG